MTNLGDVQVPVIMRNKMAKALGIDQNEVPHKLQEKVQAVYICNATGQDINAIFGTHPHGYWRGGPVDYNPATKSTTVQDLVNFATAGGIAYTGGTGVLLRANSAGKTFYMTDIQFSDNAAATSIIDITDGFVNTPLRWNCMQRAANSLDSLHFTLPLRFNTGVFWDTPAGSQVEASFQGFEE